MTADMVRWALRTATPADAALLADLHAEGFSEPWAGADLEVWLLRQDAFGVVASREDIAVGFGLALAAGDDAEILTLVTARARRGEGVGRAILNALDVEARARGLNRWLLEVASDNAPALQLYRSQGFEDIAVRRGYYRRETVAVDAHVMAKPVAPGGGQ